MRQTARILMIVMFWNSAAVTLAQAPQDTLSRQEIVERLIHLEEGQKALAQRLEDMNTALNQRIDDLRTDMNQRFDDSMTLLQIIISALVALVLAIAGAGFVMWQKILAVDAAV